jgi:hypothetical protein
MSLDGKELSRRAREYCEAKGLDPAGVSVTFNAAGEVLGHLDLEAAPGFRVGSIENLADWCCCGQDSCDGGLAERVKAAGFRPSETTSYAATIPLGGGS